MSSYFLHRNNEYLGPYTSEKLLELRTSGEIQDVTWIWEEGKTEWRSFADLFGPPPPGAPRAQGTSQGPPPLPPSLSWSKFSNKVGDLAGLEKLEGFSIGHLFSEVFKKHTPEELEEHFIVGTPQTTPTLSQVSTAWPTPWAFVRMLGITVATTFAFYIMVLQFGNPKILPAWIFTGSFAIPFATLVFFFEVNVLKNIPFFRILKLVLMGGVLSLFASLVLFSVTKFESWIGAMSAGPIEETAKLAAAYICTRKWKNSRWTLNGLLIGAAVGMGFSAFETAGYVFENLLRSMSTRTGSPENTMMLRMLTAPMTHVIWTAMTTGALWTVLGKADFKWEAAGNPKFLRIFAMAVGLHALWNSPLTIPLLPNEMGYLAKFLFLGVVGWIVILMLIQRGLKEVAEKKQSEGALS